MTESTNNSPLSLLLSVTAAILAVTAIGLYLLYQEPETSTADYLVPPVSAGEALEASIESDVVGATPDETETAIDVDAELRKARFAADADVLILPADQSALYYYGRVLKSDPQHEIALAERDVILARTAQLVQQYLVAENYAAAYEIATAVARQKPSHQLVVDTQTTLDGLAETMVAEAIAQAGAGNESEAESILATARALPGRNPDYFEAIDESIAEMKRVRQSAEVDRRQRAALAKDEARVAWVNRIELAIAAGNLTTPAGASAHDLLSERNNWSKERAEMEAAFLSTAIDATQRHIGNRRAKDAEALLAVAETYAEKSPQLATLRAAHEDLIADIESQRVVSMTELVQIKTAQPRYPQNAIKRDVTGWVDVYFTVSQSGDTEGIEVNDSDPKSIFDRAAIEAVEKWKFEPAEFRGRIIERRTAARLVFELAN